MSRSRKRVNLCPWETIDPNDHSGHYVRLSKPLLTHPSFKDLSMAARMLYIAMAEACAGKRQFRFSASDCIAYGIPRTTFNRLRKELLNGGFISIARSGRTNRQPNIYQWEWAWKDKAL